jgi:hypothetical protein
VVHSGRPNHAYLNPLSSPSSFIYCMSAVIRVRGCRTGLHENCTRSCVVNYWTLQHCTCTGFTQWILKCGIYEVWHPWTLTVIHTYSFPQSALFQVYRWGPHKCLGITSMLSVSEVGNRNRTWSLLTNISVLPLTWRTWHTSCRRWRGSGGIASRVAFSRYDWIRDFEKFFRNRV